MPGACRTSAAPRSGRLLATYVLETVGTQEYRMEPGAAMQRFADAYGGEAASEVAGHVTGARRA